MEYVLEAPRNIEKPLLSDCTVWNVRVCSVNRRIIISTPGIFDYGSLVDDWMSFINLISFYFALAETKAIDK